MPDYSNSKIYKIVNTVDEEVYIGSTTQLYLSQRMTTHRDRANNQHPERLYKHMSKIGVEHFYIDLLEEYPCQTKDQLLKKEREYILKRGTLNQKIPLRTNEEYRNDTREHHRQICKEYREKHRETYNERIVCPKCNGFATKSNIRRHQMTKQCIQSS